MRSSDEPSTWRRTKARWMERRRRKLDRKRRSRKRIASLEEAKEERTRMDEVHMHGTKEQTREDTKEKEQED